MTADTKANVHKQGAGNGSDSQRPHNFVEFISELWKRKDPPPAEPEQKKYFHIPTHAASSHLKTTSSRIIREANEVL